MSNIRKIALSAAIALGTVAAAGSALAEGLVSYDESAGVIALTTDSTQSANVTWTNDTNANHEPGIGFFQVGQVETNSGAKVEWLASDQPGAQYELTQGFYRVVN